MGAARIILCPVLGKMVAGGGREGDTGPPFTASPAPESQKLDQCVYMEQKARREVPPQLCSWRFTLQPVGRYLKNSCFISYLTLLGIFLDLSF